MAIAVITTAYIGYAQHNHDMVIHVEGNCGMCKTTIETAAKGVKGVALAHWDIDTHELHIDTKQEVNKEDLYNAIAAVGYDNEGATAPDDVYNQLVACCQYRDGNPHLLEDGDDVHYHDMVIHVEGNCGMCKSTIEEAALGVKGVTFASWDADTHELHIDTEEEVNREDLYNAIAAVGYDNEGATAPDDVYNQLVACCQYRDGNPHLDENPEVLEDVETNASWDILEAKVAESKDYDESMVYGRIIAEDNHDEPLIGANIVWQGTEVHAVTDEDGFFTIPRSTESDNLEISYVGYEEQVIEIGEDPLAVISMNSGHVLEGVTVTYRRKTTSVSFINAIKVQEIGKEELCKAACCSLSESFETNPSVNVAVSDAVTGTRKIEMLGLAGPYVQIMQENIPFARSLAALKGLAFIPGAWIESMQLNVGTGSVVNGAEGMTGQINVQLRGPESKEKLFVNLYANEGGRLESNVITTFDVNQNWKSTLLYHGSTKKRELDRNNDGFLDGGLDDKLLITNKWYYNGDNNWRSIIGISGTYDKHKAGTLVKDGEKSWTSRMKINRYEAWAKTGYILDDALNRSIGLQVSGVYHDQKARFGQKPFDAKQQSMYSNLMYQTNIKNDENILKLGVNYRYDHMQELDNWKESEVGTFGEYTFNLSERLKAVTGLRADYSSIHGFYLTPRVHLKYSPQETLAFRLAAGRGQRTATLFSENIGFFASNRTAVIKQEDGSKPYGLDAEVSYNVGANYTQDVNVNDRSMILSVDYYYTTFENQVVVDYDEDVRSVAFYNLKNGSTSHSIQAQVDYELIDGLDLRMAYRYNDVQVKYNSGKKAKIFTPKHRAFANVGYEIGKGWMVDATLSWTGSQRIPTTAGNPAEHRRAEQSPDFFLLNSHITKRVKNLDIYVGMENMTGYKQKNAIISADAPQSEFFDSSLIWGPIMGQNTYIGLRYTIEK